MGVEDELLQFENMGPRLVLPILLCLFVLLGTVFAGPTCPTCGSSGNSGGGGYVGAGAGGGAGGGAAGRAGGAASEAGAGGAGGGADLPPWCKFSNPFRSRARVDPICKELAGV